MAGDDPQDDGERTRIGGLPPPLPKAPQAPAAGAPAAPAAEEPAERTTIAPARPPGVPPAAPPPPSSSAPAPEDAGERTTIAPARPPGVPPVAPAAPAAAAPAPADTGDHTRVIATPPPGTARPAAPAAPVAPQGDVTVDPARPQQAVAQDDDERTVVLAPRKVESTMRLERRAPKGTEETISLDRPSLLLGRGHGCDVKLRTPTASREHAKIFFRNGQWMIAGVEGKSFYADGARKTGGEVALAGGMKLRLGDDEFEVVDTAGGAASRSGGGLWARLTAFVRGLFGRRT